MTNKYSLYCDDDLISLYIAGDNLAFDNLLDRYSTKLFNYIYNYVRDYDVANDFFQETFLKVICNLKSGKYKSNGKFAQWLYRLTYNLVFDQYRKDIKHLKVSFDDVNYTSLDKELYIQSNIEDSLIENQNIKEIYWLLDELPNTQKEVIKLRFFEDKSFKEIADITNVSINTALGRMRYGLMNMKKIAETKSLLCM